MLQLSSLDVTGDQSGKLKMTQVFRLWDVTGESSMTVSKLNDSPDKHWKIIKLITVEPR